MVSVPVLDVNAAPGIVSVQDGALGSQSYKQEKRRLTGIILRQSAKP